MRVVGSVVSLSNQFFEVPGIRMAGVEETRDARTVTPTLSTAVPDIDINQVRSDSLTISDKAAETFPLENDYRETSGDYSDTAEYAVQTRRTFPLSIDSDFFGLSPEDRILITILEKALGIHIRSSDELRLTGKSRANAAKRMHEAVKAARKQAEAMREATDATSKDRWMYIFQREKSDGAAAIVITIDGLVKTADNKEVGVQVEIAVAGDSAHDPLQGSLFMFLDSIGRAADIANSSMTFGLDTPSLKGVGAIYTGSPIPIVKA